MYNLQGFLLHLLAFESQSKIIMIYMSKQEFYVYFHQCRLTLILIQLTLRLFLVLKIRKRQRVS